MVMKNAYRNLRDCILYNPLGLSLLPEKVRRLAQSYIPYSTGIEFECGFNTFACATPRLEEEYFKVMHASCMVFSHDSGEKRIRIHSGERGLVELYNCMLVAKRFWGINHRSGIHYHIDVTEFVKELTWLDNDGLVDWEWVLKELDKWGYSGTYNNRLVSSSKQCWVRVGTIYKTIEFRIGEMTFEYEQLVKRILHCQSIVKRMKRIVLAESKVRHSPRAKSVYLFS